jgi:hypothetical protein
MRGLVVLVLLLGGCRQLLGLDDMPTDASQRKSDANGNDADAYIMPLPDDMDADGVKDEVDNCPTAPNPNQNNEDGDAFGDACDPCPIDIDNTDTDTDGVGDKCDPHPNTPGDRLVLFEGFGSGVPTSWTNIGAVAGSGEVSLPLVANNHTAIVPPLAMLGNGTLTVSIVIDNEGANGSASAITMPYNATNDDGIFCEFDNDTNTNDNPHGHFLDIYDTHANGGQGQGVNFTNYNWSFGVQHKLVMTRSGSNYSCTATPQGGSAHSTSGSSNNGGSLGAAQAAIALYNAGGRAQYMMLVTSP